MMMAYCLTLSFSAALFMQQDGEQSPQPQAKKILKAKSKITLRRLIQSNKTEDEVIDDITSKDLKITKAQLIGKATEKTTLELIREKKFYRLLQFLAKRLPAMAHLIDEGESLNRAKIMTVSSNNNNNNNNNDKHNSDFDIIMHDDHQPSLVIFSENIVPVINSIDLESLEERTQESWLRVIGLAELQGLDVSLAREHLKNHGYAPHAKLFSLYFNLFESVDAKQSNDCDALSNELNELKDVIMIAFFNHNHVHPKKIKNLMEYPEIRRSSDVMSAIIMKIIYSVNENIRRDYYTVLKLLLSYADVDVNLLLSKVLWYGLYLGAQCPIKPDVIKILELILNKRKDINWNYKMNTAYNPTLKAWGTSQCGPDIKALIVKHSS